MTYYDKNGEANECEVRSVRMEQGQRAGNAMLRQIHRP